jgi:predicted nucleic acid-binding protein
LKRISSKKNFISVISVAEFLAKAKPKEESKFEDLLKLFIIVDVNEEVAHQSALYRKKYLKKSRTKLLDYFIAAQAKVNNLILVTNNTEDFPMKDIKVIKP